MPSWRRSALRQAILDSGTYWYDAIPAGDTYLRVHIRWGFYADTPISTSLSDVMANLVTFGICTTIGNGTEAVPNPINASGDAAPPTQRWIYWETRAPVITAVSQGAKIVTWQDSGSTESTDTKGQVLATGLPAGSTLNLWASWASQTTWGQFQANVNLWHSVSILRKN
jgi:hypothetical protein